MAAIEVEGLSAFNRAVKQATDTEMPKRIGAANKRIGALVISKLSPRPHPAAVGAGRGADVRPSATKASVVLKAGGSHRTKSPLQPWGVKRVGGIGPAPPRPFILGTAESNLGEVEREYLSAIADAMRPAFAKTEGFR